MTPIDLRQIQIKNFKQEVNESLAYGAKNMARAYRTVQHKIETEIKFRKQYKP